MSTALIRFTLFISGRSPRSDMAITNLRRICSQLRGVECEVSIIDALERPELAEEYKVLATPTLIKETPLPRRRVTGDLSDSNRVVQMLMLAELERGEGGVE